MGFFSKKSMTCVCCGNTFQTRLGLLDMCDDCYAKQAAAEREVEGYTKYAKTMKMPQYTESQLKEIPLHRERILNAYKKSVCITKAELSENARKFSKLDKEEATEMMAKIARSMVGTQYISQEMSITAPLPTKRSSCLVVLSVAVCLIKFGDWRIKRGY